MCAEGVLDGGGLPGPEAVERTASRPTAGPGRTIRRAPSGPSKGTDSRLTEGPRGQGHPWDALGAFVGRSRVTASRRAAWWTMDLVA
jgi:hypothetical protein